MVRKDNWNAFNFFEFTKARFMAQDVIYSGEGSSLQAYLKKQEKSQLLTKATTPKATTEGRNEEPQG